MADITAQHTRHVNAVLKYHIIIINLYRTNVESDSTAPSVVE